MMDDDTSEKVTNENEMKKGYDLHYNDNLTNEYEGKNDIFDMIHSYVLQFPKVYFPLKCTPGKPSRLLKTMTSLSLYS